MISSPPPKYCKKRPRYSDGIMVHPYCGRTCANLAKGNGPVNGNTPVPTSPVKPTNPFTSTNPFIATNPFLATNPPVATSSSNRKRSVTLPANPRNSVISTSPTITQRNRSSAYRKSTFVATCKTPGCSSPAYVNQQGVASDYCTKTHRQYVSRLYLVS